MRTLVICDDYYHPARLPRAGLVPLEQAGLAFDWIENPGDWSAERMAEYPVVILTKANNIPATARTPWASAEVEAGFVEYVRSGKGLLVIHSGSSGYRELPRLRGLMGGAFAMHPPQCPVTVAGQADHPLVEGSAPFTLVDEHYHMDLDDAQAEVFLTATSEHGAQPAGWTRAEGAGRVCMLTPGHNLEVWLHPSYQMLIGNALRWCVEAKGR